MLRRTRQGQPAATIRLPSQTPENPVHQLLRHRQHRPPFQHPASAASRLQGWCRPEPASQALRGERKRDNARRRSEEHTSELQSLKRISYAVLRLKKKTLTLANTSHSTL